MVRMRKEAKHLCAHVDNNNKIVKQLKYLSLGLMKNRSCKEVLINSILEKGTPYR